MRRPLFGLLLVLALGAGCSSDEDSERAATGAGTTTARVTLSGGRSNPVLGQTLRRFVEAAAEGDADRMWADLSLPTRASIGPTLADFRAGNAGRLSQSLGDYAATARVVVSEQIGDAFGVAAITGTRPVEGEREEFAYGAAFLREGGRWKLELGGIVISGLRPEPLERAGPSPRIAANVGAADGLAELHVWIDGEPLPVETEGETAFTASIAARLDGPLAPGRHVATAFAATGDTATATAWPFTVEQP